jgi:hypothetical protein
VLFGVFSFSLTRGKRDFTSASQIVASEYAVLCLTEQAGAARQLLQQLPGGAGRSAGSAPEGPWSMGTPGAGPGAGTGVGPGVGGPAGPSYPTNPYAPPSSSSSPAGGASAPTQPVGAPGNAGGPAAPPPPDEPGLTYGEAIERQRRARLERERLEREGRV